MEKLLIPPDADGYSSTDGNELASTPLDGGPSRIRRDKIGAPKMVQAKWTMNPQQYQYWRAFFNTATEKGALKFTCDLLSEDGAGPVEQVCQFVPGSVSLPAQQGLTYVQQASLEVTPLPVDDAFNDLLFLTVNNWGFGNESLLRSLEKLVTVTAPSTIGA